MSSNYW